MLYRIYYEKPCLHPEGEWRSWENTLNRIRALRRLGALKPGDRVEGLDPCGLIWYFDPDRMSWEFRSNV